MVPRNHCEGNMLRTLSCKQAGAASSYGWMWQAVGWLWAGGWGQGKPLVFSNQKVTSARSNELLIDKAKSVWVSVDQNAFYKR